MIQRSRSEAILEREVLIALGQAPDLALYRNEVGQGHPGIVGKLLEDALREMPEALRTVRSILGRHRIAFGLGVGSPDLVGALEGRALGLELKTPGGRVSPEQERWHEAARRRGVAVFTVRTVEEARMAIDRARKGELR